MHYHIADPPLLAIHMRCFAVRDRGGETEIHDVGNRKFSGDPEIGLSVFHAHALVNSHGRLRAVSPIDETD